MILIIVTTVSSFHNIIQDDSTRRAPTAYERAQSILRDKQLHDTFNATEQRVPVTGCYHFIAPSSTDLRGPCPFLNAAANHGYIDRSGYTTAWEVVSVAVNIFGMGTDLVTFLACTQRSSMAILLHSRLAARQDCGRLQRWRGNTQEGQDFQAVTTRWSVTDHPSAQTALRSSHDLRRE